MRPRYTSKAVLRWMAAAWTGDARERQENPWKAEAIGWPTLYLQEPRMRTMVTLLAWAVGREERVSEVVRNNGWSRATFDRKTGKGLQLIADALNERDAREERRAA